MHPFRNLSIRFKVALMGGILIVAFLILGGTYAFSIDTLNNAYQLLGKTQDALKGASEFQKSCLEMEASLREYLTTGDASMLAIYRKSRDQAQGQLFELRTAVSDPDLRLPMNPKFKRQIGRMEDYFHAWQSDVTEPLGANQPPKDLNRLFRFLRESELPLRNINKEVDSFQTEQQALNYNRGRNALKAAEFAQQTAFFGSGLTLLLVLLGFSALSRSIVDPLIHLTNMTQAIAAGDYSKRVPIPGRSELGRLAASFNVMAENLDTVQSDQSSIRNRLEALNRLAAFVSRSLHARDRAEAVVMTLRQEFGAMETEVWLPQTRQGWICISAHERKPVEYHLFGTLPDKYQIIISARRPEEEIHKESARVEWICPLMRADRLSGILRVCFPPEEWTPAEPLLSSINRFCTNAFELARVYEEVSGEQQRLDAILSSTGEGVLVRDREGRLALANPAALRVLGLEDRQVVGQPLGTVLEAEKYENLRAFIEAPLTNLTEPESSEALPLGDCFITATRALIRNAAAMGIVVVVRDVTQQVEVDRMKSEFISIVSHELRTPLTSIKGSLGLLLGGAAGKLPEKMEQLLQIAQNNSDRLIRLINDILDISKIEAGRVEMTREPVDLAEVAQVAAQGLEAMAASSQVRIEVEVPEKGALVVNGDRDRLLQVTTNLISNAIKFSPSGSAVTVCAEAEVHMAEVNVIDRGPGIPAEHQAKLFQKFYQVDSSSARAKSGTGLGLAISHALIREHGGLIGVESAEGQGSRFWFTLPLLSRPHLGGIGTETKRPHVLVCDDDRDIANLISHLLQDGGYTCDQVYSGQELLERVKREHYDIITLDLAMPGMDGLEVARQLQEDPELNDLPIVFVSVYKESPQAKSLHLAGWITKPIDEDVFLDAVRRALRMRNASLNGRKRQGDPLILLVDDDADVLKVVGAMVESAGMRVSSAQGGGEALKKIREEEPDAVVLDLMMPGIDGFEVISTLRQSERTAHIPILVLTAKDLTKEEQERLQSEETRFLTKSYASQKAILDDLSSLLLNHDGKTV